MMVSFDGLGDMGFGLGSNSTYPKTQKHINTQKRKYQKKGTGLVMISDFLYGLGKNYPYY
jgi:hypothetical protein